MGIKEEDSNIKEKEQKIIGFYNSLQSKLMVFADEDRLTYITSRSTEETIAHIETICAYVKNSCIDFCIPNEGVFLKKTELSVNAFKYLICNTNFDSQSLLADDTSNGHLVDMQPPISIYLLIEILWHCNFEEILAESILHFPLDICVQILEILPRCIDLLNFERANKFLTTIISNAYTKLILLRNKGSQTQDVNKKASLFSAHTIELILQFMSSRFLQFENISKAEQYKRHGILLKSIVQMVRLCFTSKTKQIELTCEMEKLYKLNFGHAEFHKIKDKQLQKLLTDIDRDLISLLLKKVKEIDCNIYINWTEYDDTENTAVTLQRAIGLECYFFIENTKGLVSPELKDYEHLIECLGQLASKPDNSVESMQLEDLAHGAREGRKECLITLFRRYKEWDDSIVDAVDSKISLLEKNDYEGIFEYLATEIVLQSHPEKLQTSLLCLSKGLVFLKITELYEITIKFILKFGEEYNLENLIDIANFERFVSLNSNISTPKNLRVVLYFLCLKPKATLKILLKMVMGHADYPDVAVTIDDLMLLEPIMKIQTRSRDDTLIDVLRHKCSSETTKPRLISSLAPKKKTNRSLVVRILQDICLDAGEWNFNKFASLLQALYSFCEPTEFVLEIFAPLILSDRCTLNHMRCTLLELRKIAQNLDKDAQVVAHDAVSKRGVWLLKSNNISRYVVDELLTNVEYLINLWKSDEEYLAKNSDFGFDLHYHVFLSNDYSKSSVPAGCELSWKVSLINSKSQQETNSDDWNKTKSSPLLSSPPSLFIDDILRFIMTKCTKKQYLDYTRQMIVTTQTNIMRDGSKAVRCDWIIRLTLETCLLCLEFPMVAAHDSVSFLIRCLSLFLSTVMDTTKQINSELCESLDTHLEIFKPIAQYTSISEAFAELANVCGNPMNDLAARIKALEVFALKCTENMDKLKTYEGPNSPMAIKLYVGYDIISLSMTEDAGRQEEYFRKLAEHFKSQESRNCAKKELVS